MARKPPGKSETLTIRLDPKSRFMLEFLSRLRGQTITTVVERAIADAADAAYVGPNDATWKDFWDVSEGIRSLHVAGLPDLRPSFEEERRLAFTKEHWPFFYINSYAVVFDRPQTEVLWPRIDEFVKMHDDRRHEDYFAAGKAMQQALREAKIIPPEWPQGAAPTQTTDDEPPPF